MDNIELRVKEVIADKLGIDKLSISNDARFTADLGADSLDTIELILRIEEEFGVSIPDQDAENIETVQQAIDYISALDS